MIDIVFLLIIFFMTVSQITRTRDVPLPLPQVTRGDSDATSPTVTINIDQAGHLIVGGQQLPLNSVTQRVEQLMAETDRRPKDIRVQIRVHRKCESRHVTELLQRLAELGFTNVHSAVTD